MKRSSIFKATSTRGLLCSTAALLLAVTPLALTPSSAFAQNKGGASSSSGGSNSGGASGVGGDSGSGTGGSGTGGPGTGRTGTKGYLFGDLVVILRGSNGVPIVTADGLRPAAWRRGQFDPAGGRGGAPLDPTLVVPVELGRTHVGRAPERVLDTLTDVVMALLTDADLVSILQDAAGGWSLRTATGWKRRSIHHSTTWRSTQRF